MRLGHLVENKEMLQNQKDKACNGNAGINLKMLPMAKAGKYSAKKYSVGLDYLPKYKINRVHTDVVK